MLSIAVVNPTAPSYTAQLPPTTEDPFVSIRPGPPAVTPTGTTVRDVNGDGFVDQVFFEQVTGAAKTSSSRLWVVDGRNGKNLVEPFNPFEASFQGGLVVVAVDLNRDGAVDLVVGADVTGGPRVQVFSFDSSRNQLAVRDNFFAIDDLNFRGGVRLAMGDLNSDGVSDLTVTAGPGGGPRAVVFNGQGLFGQNRSRLVPDFFAFPGADASNLRDGAAVMIRDVNRDGVPDLFFGAGPGGAPRVTVLDGAMTLAKGSAAAQADPLGDGFIGDNTSARSGVRFSTSGNNVFMTDLATGKSGYFLATSDGGFGMVMDYQFRRVTPASS